MELLTKIKEFGAGYKTYIAAAGFLLLAAHQGYEGNADKAMEYVTAAMAIVGLRHALTRKETPP